MDRTNAERQRRYIARLKERAAAASPPVTNGAGGDELAKLKAENAALKAELIDTLGARFAPKARAAKPKAEKAPLPPDEERDRIIKGLKTRVKNLSHELHATRQHAREMQAKTGAMDFRTMAAIAKCLFPDQRGNATEADKDNACRLFTAWKADNRARKP